MQRVAIFLILLLSSSCSSSSVSVPIPEEPQRFTSPAEAAAALNQAALAEDKRAMLKVLGADGARFVDTGNLEKDRRALERFSRQMTERHSLEAKPGGEYILYFGANADPFPLAIVRDGESWQFAGESE